MRPKIASHVAWQVVDGEAVIINVASGATIGLNPTATFIWTQLDGRSQSELAAATASQFGVEPGRAAADVEEILGEWQRRSLIVDADGERT